MIANIPYGAQVEAIDVCLDGTWINVSYNGIDGYVMIRYLSDSQPGPKPTKQPSVTVQPTSTDASIDYSTFADVSYSATVRASVTSGVVHMRWAPSKRVAIKRDYNDGDLLEVIASNGQWAQVRDPQTGAVGYMMLQFLQAGDGLVPTATETTSMDG